MKSLIKASVIAGALAFSAGSQAASIGLEDVFVSIVRDGISGESMLVNTGLNAKQLFNGTVTSFTSDAAMTTAIGNFLTGAANVQWYAVGRFVDGFDKFGISDRQLPDPPATLGFIDVNVPAFISDANVGRFGKDIAGDGGRWETGIPSGDKAHYQNANISGNGFVVGAGLDTPVGMKVSQTGFFAGVKYTDLGNFMLASSGELSYSTSVSAVPIPAAVWLFGSGLMGLVGVARRRGNK